MLFCTHNILDRSFSRAPGNPTSQAARDCANIGTSLAFEAAEVLVPLSYVVTAEVENGDSYHKHRTQFPALLPFNNSTRTRTMTALLPPPRRPVPPIISSHRNTTPEAIGKFRSTLCQNNTAWQVKQTREAVKHYWFRMDQSCFCRRKHRICIDQTAGTDLRGLVSFLDGPFVSCLRSSVAPSCTWKSA